MAELTCANCDDALVPRDYHGNDWLYCQGCNYWWTGDKPLALAHRCRRPVPEGSQVSLVFEPNGKGHRDLVLRVGSWLHRSDSYYYALDRFEHPVPSLRALLEQWKQAVAEAKPGVAFFLPHDFSDQYTGWLRATLSDDVMELVPGWSNLEGYKFFPSDHLEVARALSDFKPLENIEPYQIKQPQLVDDIERSLQALPG